MRVLLVGTYSGGLDEGLAQLSKRFYNHFKELYEVKAVNTNEVFRPKSIREISAFGPQVIHYLTGPTIRSFLSLRFLRLICRYRPITVMSATRPFLLQRDLRWLNMLTPDLILTQATKWEQIFRRYQIETSFLPNPVDLQKFKRLDVDRKSLRQKYELPLEKKLLLHVGHLRSNRNLELLAELQEALSQKECQIVIVGSTNFEPEPEVVERLQNAGCLIINRYLESISELYNACDCYLFPLPNMSAAVYPESYNQVGVIDLPLSILESLCCGLPVITTDIDALKKLTADIPGTPVFYCDPTTEAFETAVQKMPEKNNDAFERVRERVSQHAVFECVDSIYQECQPCESAA